MQFNNHSLKTVFGIAGALSVGLSVSAPAIAQDMDIMDAYTPPETQTYDPVHDFVDFDRVKSFLCTQHPGPLCTEIDDTLRLSEDFPANYGVNDEMRRPSSFYCLNNPNILCENPPNYMVEREPVGSDLRARTRDLWAQLDAERTTPSTPLPPRATTPPPVMPTPSVAPAPVPGLW
ncbi:MAG: hypothetical protein SAJ12_16805 [Jaaginema sp. PMC 1079.18]|nr:hypothetical protein [Jaaginema sp. PMC 1080.18]MEC4852644.1 hypothetical protein [Jaaginema sp. PMC 1079.18]MEC4866715.1 hypothetical protein [Jaaginema sp. PMC 1078.18]